MDYLNLAAAAGADKFGLPGITGNLDVKQLSGHAERLWQFLDELAANDPNGYKDFLGQQAKAAGVQPNEKQSPQPQMDSVPALVLHSHIKPKPKSSERKKCIISFWANSEGQDIEPARVDGAKLTPQTSSWKLVHIPMCLRRPQFTAGGKGDEHAVFELLVHSDALDLVVKGQPKELSGVLAHAALQFLQKTCGVEVETEGCRVKVLTADAWSNRSTSATPTPTSKASNPAPIAPSSKASAIDPYKAAEGTSLQDLPRSLLQELSSLASSGASAQAQTPKPLSTQTQPQQQLSKQTQRQEQLSKQTHPRSVRTLANSHISGNALGKQGPRRPLIEVLREDDAGSGSDECKGRPGNSGDECCDCDEDHAHRGDVFHDGCDDVRTDSSIQNGQSKSDGTEMKRAGLSNGAVDRLAGNGHKSYGKVHAAPDGYSDVYQQRDSSSGHKSTSSFHNSAPVVQNSASVAAKISTSGLISTSAVLGSASMSSGQAKLRREPLIEQLPEPADSSDGVTCNIGSVIRIPGSNSGSTQGASGSSRPLIQELEPDSSETSNRLVGIGPCSLKCSPAGVKPLKAGFLNRKPNQTRKPTATASSNKPEASYGVIQEKSTNNRSGADRVCGNVNRQAGGGVSSNEITIDSGLITIPLGGSDRNNAGSFKSSSNLNRHGSSNVSTGVSNSHGSSNVSTDVSSTHGGINELVCSSPHADVSSSHGRSNVSTAVSSSHGRSNVSTDVSNSHDSGNVSTGASNGELRACEKAKVAQQVPQEQKPQAHLSSAVGTTFQTVGAQEAGCWRRTQDCCIALTVVQEKQQPCSIPYQLELLEEGANSRIHITVQLPGVQRASEAQLDVIGPKVLRLRAAANNSNQAQQADEVDIPLPFDVDVDHVSAKFVRKAHTLHVYLAAAAGA